MANDELDPQRRARRELLTAGTQLALAGAATLVGAAAAAPAAAMAPTTARAGGGAPAGASVAGRKFRAWVHRDLVPGEVGRLEQLTLLPIAGRQVLIRTEATQCCYTNVNRMLGTASSTRAGLGIISRDPMILGHGGVGYVEAVGPQVKRVRVGDRVVVSVSPQCGECHACLHGRADHCQTGFSEPNMPIATLADGTPVVQSTNIGGHAELMVALEEYCCAVHSSLPAEQLAMLSCVSGTGLGMTMTLSPVEPGANVVVFGAGPVGLSAVQGARIKGATRIIVIEPIRVRRELALKLGATHALDPNAAGERLVAQVRELCRGDFDTVFAGGRTTDLQRAGADIVIEAVGGDRIRPTLEQGPDPSGILPLQQSWEACAAGGHVMTCGVGQVGAVSFPAVAWSNGSKTHHSSQYGGTHPKRDLPAYVRLIEAGLFDAGALATSLYSLEQTHEAFQATGARTTVAAVLRFS